MRPIVPLVWQEGRREGQVATIEKLVSTGVAWFIIEAATGIDQEAFDYAIAMGDEAMQVLNLQVVRIRRA